MICYNCKKKMPVYKEGILCAYASDPTQRKHGDVYACNSCGAKVVGAFGKSYYSNSDINDIPEINKVLYK